MGYVEVMLNSVQAVAVGMGSGPGQQTFTLYLLCVRNCDKYRNILVKMTDTDSAQPPQRSQAQPRTDGERAQRWRRCSSGREGGWDC